MLERRKEQMIAALWANPNLDGKDGNRSEALEAIEEQYATAISFVRQGAKVEEEGEEIDKENPFFAAAERGVEKIQAPRNDEGKVREVIDYNEQIDQ